MGISIQPTHIEDSLECALARCERQYRDLAEQLRFARAEQERIRSLFQVRMQASFQENSNQLAAMQIELEAAQHDISALTEQRVQLQRTLAEDIIAYEQVQSELRSVYKSNSWRITAPLRLARRLLVWPKLRS